VFLIGPGGKVGFYNATILSRLWEYRKSVGDPEGAAEILNVSPVAWIHLNFRGRYKFRNREKPIDIDAIVRKLAKAQIKSRIDQVA